MNAPGQTITVAILEDERLTREGLRALIDAKQGFRCIAAWSSVEEALKATLPSSPDIALVDLELPGLSGIEGIPLLRNRFPRAAFVVLTVYEENDRIFEALCAGAAGYLLKNTTPERLIECVREAADGGSPISPVIARKVVELFRRYKPQQSKHDLTPHELRLLKLLVEGHSYRSAAAELKVTVNTISFHVRSIYSKLEVHSKSAAVARALTENLLG